MSIKIKLCKIETGEIVEMTPEEIVKEVNNPDWHCDEWIDYLPHEWREALNYYKDYAVVED